MRSMLLVETPYGSGWFWTPQTVREPTSKDSHGILLVIRTYTGG